MKNTLLVLITLTLITASPLCASEQETEFIERFRSVIEAEDMTPHKLLDIWSFNESTTHYVMYMRIRGSIKDAMLRGIEDIEIVDFSIPEGTPKNILEGVTYEYKPTPTKLLSVTYKKKMEGAAFKWSWALGEVGDKLYLVELSPVDPIEDAQ